MERLIDSTELRKIQMEILHHVDAFCRQKGIRYFLCGGTLIGAVRHHGYIPWDDDIDIMLLREDYERFIETYLQDDKSDYKLHYFRKEKDFPYPFVKIDDSRTVLSENVEIRANDMGVNIDVFPIDVVPEDKELQKKLYGKFSFYMALINLKNIIPTRTRSWYKNLMIVLSRLILWMIPMRALVRRLEDNAIRYRDSTSKYCGIALWGYGMREINLRENWTEAIDMKFEDTMLPVPVGYDNYLTCVYGDYMQLPPEEKRVTHHAFTAYWK